MGRRMTLVLIAFIVVIVGGSFAYAQYRYGSGPTPQACTAEAKICPDGTAVGRTGPNCSFAPCPTTATTTDRMAATTTGASTTGTATSSATHSATLTFSGKLLAGSLGKSPLLEFSEPDYDAAVAAGKLIVLFFYTNWDQFSETELDAMKTAFNTLPAGAVGFRVDFNDSAMSADEIILSRDLSVGISRMKIIMKNGTYLLRSTDPWNANDFTTEIKARL